jgi:F-type H+-transporting ATPase subunit b
VVSYLAEVLGFLLLLAFTYRYAWPLLKKMMDGQAESIRNALSSSDLARDSGQRVLAEAREALEAAHLEAGAIVARAEETSGQLRLEGERRAEQEYHRLVASAAAEAEFERQRAREDVTRHIGAIVMAATESVVAAEVDASLQRAYISETIDAAEAMA